MLSTLTPEDLQAQQAYVDELIDFCKKAELLGIHDEFFDPAQRQRLEAIKDTIAQRFDS